MSHLIVEVVRLLPIEGILTLITAENWIINDKVYYPNDSFFRAYHLKFLTCGEPPNNEKWDSFDLYKILVRLSLFKLWLSYHFT